MLRTMRLAVALLVCPVPVLANDADISTSGWVGLTALAFDYEEFSGAGDSLDRDEGWLPGVQAGLSRDYGHWFLEGGLRWSSGQVDYTSPAASSKADEEVGDIWFSAGVPVLMVGGTRTSLIAGLGYREWQREIRSTAEASGLDETYRWGYGLLGVRGEKSVGTGTRVVMDAQLTRPIHPDIKVRFDSAYDDVSLDLGERTGFRVDLTIDRKLDDTKAIWLTPWYEHWKLGRSNDSVLFSNGVPAGAVFEPRSETDNYGISIGMRWQFD